MNPADPSAPAPARPVPPPVPVLAVDIGGTTTTAAAVLPGHRIAVRAAAPTPAQDGPDAVLATALRLARAVRDAAADRGAAAPAAAGVGTAGVVGPDGRTVAAATSALPGWAGTAVADRFEEALGVPATVLGDVQAFLAGEAAAGAARGAHLAVAAMAGTGIGGAVAVGGRVLRGASGAAGHLGHVPVPGAEGRPCPCGRDGHVEALASGPAMAAGVRRLRPGLPVPDLRAAARLARDGDPAAAGVLRAGGEALGTALAGVVAVLDPDVVVLGGGVLAAGPWYADALRSALARHTLPLLRAVPVVQSVLDADAVLLGAAAEARAALADPVPAAPADAVPAHPNGATA
ncbi:ROK family protein [Streptomyces sp. NPDC001380]|uniref:ROK family protein n=1 Tax=Streptomyces sp. NPDC001380 TaxID=3364566 RepID=UPI00368A6546